MFSPYYRKAFRRDASTAADDHCALNVCLYGPQSNRWTMTERGRRHVQRSAQAFDIGPSRMAWDGSALRVDIDERCTPLPRRVQGRVTLHPQGLARYQTALDTDGRHRWGPIAPCARVEVALSHPRLHWSGHAYLDSNEGDEPVERAFERWDWLRTPLPDGRCAVLYDVQPRQGEPRLIGARFAPNGDVQPFSLDQHQQLPASRWWRVARRTPVDKQPAVLKQTLEDTPFYARSLMKFPLAGHTADAIHETLDMGRLCSPVVQWMLPWRMPRVV